MEAAAIKMAFAKLVTDKRTERGWSGEDLAKRMTRGPRGPGGEKPHMSRAMVSKIEQGACDITITKLFELARVLGTTPQRLLPKVSKVEEVHVESPCETVVHPNLTETTD